MPYSNKNRKAFLISSMGIKNWVALAMKFAWISAFNIYSNENIIKLTYSLFN